MFTGIVEELGEVVGMEPLGDCARLTIRGPVVTADAGHGDSIAVNGVCLTVVEVLPGGQFTADVMGETLTRSSLRGLEVGSAVNLERAAAVNGRLGGHIVQGHVDGTGRILAGLLPKAGKWCASSCRPPWTATSSRRAPSRWTASR
ncbi:lumazine binding domain protein [Mycobacterium xenopi 4042]|uniref:Riboflavin synthase n=1 Tax=Mycobacterium xenopi 4042 TaxID=1299334 RepID=X7YP72_MYCXE|nr:lumazine binding domain protein [Mycobacterium xenopi 4042]